MSSATYKLRMPALELEKKRGVCANVRGAEIGVADTRAVNWALRKAYGTGICSVEEIGAFSRPPASEENGNHRKRPPQPVKANGNIPGRITSGTSPPARGYACASSGVWKMVHAVGQPDHPERGFDVLATLMANHPEQVT